MACRIPLNDLENSHKRLNNFLAAKSLIFNPYKVDDGPLMEWVAKCGWGGEFDLTQHVTMTFTRLREAHNSRGFDGIYARIGTSQNEALLPAYFFLGNVTALDDLRGVWSTIGTRHITNEKQVTALVGKRMFISAVIRGKNVRGDYCPAYRMTRLTGKEQKDAAAVRNAMCEAKIEMLNRLMENPDCKHYLDCSDTLFDFKTRIRRAISIIRTYPQARQE